MKILVTGHAGFIGSNRRTNRRSSESHQVHLNGRVETEEEEFKQEQRPSLLGLCLARRRKTIVNIFDNYSSLQAKRPKVEFINTLDRMRVRYDDEGNPCGSNCTYYAYCLMSNHFHLLIREREETVGETVKRIASSYVYYYNRKAAIKRAQNHARMSSVEREQARA